MSYTDTSTYTYSVTDVEIVMRRFSADIVMIATSSGAITEAEARSYARDIEVLARAGHLSQVDLTLFSGNTEVRAARYDVNTSSGHLTMSRPGGVMWPRVTNADLRVVLSYTSTYTNAARERMREKLKLSWGPTSADTSHSSLTPNGGRDYVSNGWGMQRKDYGT